MIALTILAGLLVALVGSWLLVETHRAGRTTHWLTLVIPTLFAWPLAIQIYGSSPLSEDFTLLHAYADEAHRTVYALVQAKGESDPRLYVITRNYEDARKAFAAAQIAVAKGLPVAGRQLRNGLNDEGSFVFYQLPRTGVPEKG